MINENQHTEFKSSFNDEVVETLVAFANTKGGRVLVGVDNRGRPVKGFSVGDETIQKWLNEIKQKTQPSIIPNAEVVAYKNEEVVELFIPEFPVKPVSFKGRYFRRVKNSNHQLSPIEIANMNLASLQVSWDAYPAHGVSLQDLDMSKVESFVSRVNSVGRFRLDGTAVECLEKLRLLNERKVTNAANLLFSKKGSVYNVHLGRFKTPSQIIDDKMLRLTLFEAVEETQKYLTSHIKVAFEITGATTRRTEILEYPPQAIRELVLNTLVHRDYLSPADVQIKVFDKHISFFNPGNLHGELTVEQLKGNNYPAFARNKLIAEAFYLTGDIEKYGSGFQRIRKAIESYPTMMLECEETPLGFMATIGYEVQKIRSTPQELENTPQELENTPQELENTPQELENTPQEPRVKITKAEERVLLHLKQNSKITRDEMAQVLNISADAVRQHLANLKRKGVVSRVGSTKAGYWRINRS